MFRIEVETEADWWDVEALFDLSFAPGREALSSYRLREGVAPIASLCRVAKDDLGIIGGAIRFWPVRVGTVSVLLLGPVAVHPTRQGEGLGAALIRDGLIRASEQGWGHVLLIGDLAYYKRFGFRQISGISFPPPTNPERVLGQSLDRNGTEMPQGTVRAAITN